MALTKLQREFIEHLIISADTGLTDARWADLNSIPPNRCQSWKSKPDFQKALATRTAEYEATRSVTKQRTWLWSLEEAVTNYDRAKDGTERRKWWEIVNKLTAEQEVSNRVDYSEFTDEELWSLIIDRGLDEKTLRIEAAKAALGG